MVITMPENTHCDLGIVNFKTFLLLFSHLKIDAICSAIIQMCFRTPTM